MVHTFKGLRDQVLRLIGEDGDTVPETVVKDLMNQAHMNRVTQHEWPFMKWFRHETLSVSSGTSRYVLHQEYGKGINFINTSTGEQLIEVPSRETLDRASQYGDSAGTGAPREFFLADTQQVKAQPATPATVNIVSSSASDTTAAKAIIIKGETSTGDVTTESITPNGVTPVVSSTTWKTILQVTKSATWTGTLTLKDAASVTLLTLYPTEMGRTYRVLEFLRPPDAGATIAYTFFRKPLELVNDYDIPQLPDQHAQILVWDTLLLMAGYVNIQGDLSGWVQMQERLERNLYREYGFDQSTRNAGPTFIKYTGDY